MFRAYVFIVLSAAGVACFSVVDVVYFQSVGYSLAFIGVMAAAFNVAVTASELPFAVLFDRYSNKLALQLGNLIRMAAFGLFFLDLNVETLVLAQVLAGIGVAAASGTTSALIINEIHSTSPSRLSSALGKIQYIVAAATLAGGALGLLAFAIEPHLIWLAAILCFIAAGVVIATFRDTRASIEKIPWSEYVRRSFGILRGRVTWFYVITNASSVAPFLLWQIKFETTSLAFVFAGFLGMKLANMLAPFAMRWMKVAPVHVGVVAATNCVVTAAFAFSASPAITWATFALHVGLQAVQIILISALFHADIDNSYRATSESMISMADSLIVAVVAPVIAVLGELQGIEWAILVSCALYLIVAAGAAMPAFRTRVRSLEREAVG